MPFNIADFPEALALPVRLMMNSQWVLHTPMAAVLVRMLMPRSLVELGVFRGDSYAAFCETVLALRAGAAGADGAENIRCSGVDSWTGDEHGGFYGPEILAELRTFHDPRYAAFSQLNPSTFDDALPHVPDASVDLLHIDGLHSYEAVAHDFQACARKLSDRAVVLFHDTTERLPGFGVWQFWAEIAGDFPGFNVPYGHGLGMLAVGKNAPLQFLDLLSELNHAPQRTLGPFQALGTRNEIMLRSTIASNALHSCQHIANQWRALMGQPIRNATPNVELARHSPGTFAPAAVEDVLQMANDAANLARQATASRNAAPAVSPGSAE